MAVDVRTGRRAGRRSFHWTAATDHASVPPGTMVHEVSGMSTAPMVGVGHLTMLDVAPPDWVSLAAQTGFDAVGIRVAAVGPTEEPWPMTAGSTMLAETRRRLDDTGVRVLDVELIKLAPDSDPARY